MSAGNVQNSNLLFSKVGLVQSLSNLSPAFLWLDVLNPALSDGKAYQWLKMEGSYGGKTGIFEYTKDANGIINHRFF